MLSLDSDRWSEIRHAYGPASDTPTLLRRLASTPEASGTSELWLSLYGALAHQGDVYPASFAAVPHVLHTLETAPDRASYECFGFPAWVEICRRNHEIEVPGDLAAAYFESLAKVPLLVAAVSPRPWDEVFLRSVLAAVAAARGEAKIAEAVLELSPDVAGEFMDWCYSR